MTVNAGVTVATAKDILSGVLHDLPQIDDPFSQLKTVSVALENTPPPPPPPEQIPTLSAWVMIMFAVFLALAGGVALRRKRIAWRHPFSSPCIVIIHSEDRDRRVRT